MNMSPHTKAALSPNDENHLNLLSIFYYVFGGLGLLGGLGLVVHYLVMHAVMDGTLSNGQNTPAPPPELFMIMQAMYVGLGSFLVLGIALNVLAAVFLRQRRHRVFSMVVAGLNCLQIPLGTVLGVFTFVVLMRESVRAGYEQVAFQK